MEKKKIREIIQNNIQEIFNSYPDVMARKTRCDKCGHWSFTSPELNVVIIVDKLTDYVMKWTNIREEIFLSAMGTTVDKIEQKFKSN